MSDPTDAPTPAEIQCPKPGVWTLQYGAAPKDSDFTESCTEHLGTLLSDATEHRVYPSDMTAYDQQPRCCYVVRADAAASRAPRCPECESLLVADGKGWRCQAIECSAYTLAAGACAVPSQLLDTDCEDGDCYKLWPDHLDSWCAGCKNRAVLALREQRASHYPPAACAVPETQEAEPCRCAKPAPLVPGAKCRKCHRWTVAAVEVDGTMRTVPAKQDAADWPAVPVQDAPQSLVAGDMMTRPIYEFVRACEHLLSDEQAKPNPDNALIAVLCDAVRLTRELSYAKNKDNGHELSQLCQLSEVRADALAKDSALHSVPFETAVQDALTTLAESLREEIRDMKALPMLGATDAAMHLRLQGELTAIVRHLGQLEAPLRRAAGEQP